MATFPALEPKTRAYSFGAYPVSEESGFVGGAVRFRHGTTSFSHTLALGFTALTEAQAKLLRDHYRAQQGGYLSFPLSTEAWAGHTTFTDLVPATTLWRYAKPLDETHGSGGLFDVTAELLSCIA
jgi:hypothetical protein